MKPLLMLLLLFLRSLPGQAQAITDLDRDALAGPVRSVQVNRIGYTDASGKFIELNHIHDLVIYDKAGNREKERERYPYYYNCFNDVKIETTYDATGFRTDTLTITPLLGGGELGKEVNTFDRKDRLIETAWISKDGSTDHRMVYKRDEKGNPQEIEYYNSGRLSMKVSSTYEYDSKGNWIKQIDTKWDYRSNPPHSEPSMVWYRTITYY